MPESLAAKVATFSSDVSDWAVVDALNAPDPQLAKKRVRIPISAVRSLYLARGFWGAIARVANDAAQPTAVRDLCVTVRDTCTLLSELATDDPSNYAAAKAAADGLLAAGLIDQATHDALIALAEAPSSWSDINNGGQPVTVQAVEQARRGG